MAEKGKYYRNSYGNTFGVSIPTPIGRATFVHLVQPNAKYQPAKFGLHLLFPKDDPAVKKGLNAIIAQCKEMAEEAYGKEVPAFTYGPLRDGDEQKYQGFAGCWYMKLASKNRPEIVDTQREGLDPNLILPGVMVRAVVTPVMFDSGFSYQLQCVQFVKDDGVRYYGGQDPKSLLSALDEEGADAPAEEPTQEVVVSSAPKTTVVAKPAAKVSAKAAAGTGKAAALNML